MQVHFTGCAEATPAWGHTCSVLLPSHPVLELSAKWNCHWWLWASPSSCFLAPQAPEGEALSTEHIGYLTQPRLCNWDCRHPVRQAWGSAESKCCPFTGAVPFLPSLISGYPCQGQESGCPSPGAFPLLWGHTWGGGFKAQDWSRCKTEATPHGGDGRGQCQALIWAALGFGDWIHTLGCTGPVGSDLYLQNADPRTDVARVRVCFLFCSALRQDEDVWSAHGTAAGAHKFTENPARSLTGFSGVSLTCGSVELSETLQ